MMLTCESFHGRNVRVCICYVTSHNYIGNHWPYIFLHIFRQYMGKETGKKKQNR